MTAKKKADSDNTPKETTEQQKETCGIIMPISGMTGYPSSHWRDVLTIISDSIEDAKFFPQPVWDSKATNIIQAKIVNNLYETPIAVCDVSGKNPNVMFELGMRLAFDKPTIILKDDDTEYFFDGSPIEYIPYPKDLRFPVIEEVKKELSNKLKSMHDQSTKGKFKSFLSHFGKFDVKGLESQKISLEQLLLEILDNVKINNRFAKKDMLSLSLTGVDTVLEKFKEYINMTSPDILPALLKKYKKDSNEVIRYAFRTGNIKSLSGDEVEYLQDNMIVIIGQELEKQDKKN